MDAVDAVVVATGMDTEMGKVGATPERTDLPLQIALRWLSHTLTVLLLSSHCVL